MDEVERLRGLLAELEWAGRDDNARDYCVVCERYYGNPHKDDCWLAAELQRP